LYVCYKQIHTYKLSKKLITYYLRNFNNTCCKKWLEHCLNKANITAVEINTGSVTLAPKDTQKGEQIIKKAGFQIIQDKNLIKIEAIKQAIYELIHLQSNQNSIIQKSEYLIEKLEMPYSSISKLFSRYESSTLERYIIKNKIIKIIDLIEHEDYTLSEIAYMMDYSSVQHLSNQFKKETSYTFSDFKNLDSDSKHQILEHLGE